MCLNPSYLTPMVTHTLVITVYYMHLLKRIISALITLIIVLQ